MGKLYLLTGNDEFAIKSRAREIAQELCGENPEENPELEIIAGDRDDTRPEEILTELYNALKTPPFLCPEKKIWLKHFQYFEKVLGGAATEKKDKQAMIDVVTDFLKGGLPADTTLIIDGPDIDKRKAFFKTCKDQGEVIVFEKADINSKDFAKNQYIRISEICDKARKSIDQRAIGYLADTIGSDTGRLRSELEKLFCYVGKRDNITLEDCKNICSRTPEAMSWDFANALVARDIPLAMDIINTLMEQMRSSGGGELGILHQAINIYQEMVQTKCAAAQLGIKGRCGKSYFYGLPVDVKEKYPENFLLRIHPFRAYVLCENAASYTDTELVDALNALLEANRKLVSGGCDPRIALEQLTLATAQRR